VVALPDAGDHPYAVLHFQEDVILSTPPAYNKIETLPAENLFKLENFGHSISGPTYVFRPTHVEQIAGIFKQARKHGFTIGLRGAGRSYGDAAMNNGEVVLDLQRMNRVLDWNPQTGVIKMEPGVTIEQLWRYTLEDGWLSPVNPGTMKPTIGGCLGANVHGKNNWRQGTIGDHVIEFEALLPNGHTVTCSPRKNKDLFYSMISGMGMLGVFTSITYQMHRIYSGLFNVYAWAEPNIERVVAAADENKENDYIVGWVDCTARGRGLGRGQMHLANYLKEGEDLNPAQTLSLDNQDLPANIMGLVPRSVVPLFMGIGLSVNMGARLGNWGKYLASRTLSHKKSYQQSFVEFNFLLDYVPDWEYAYGKGGLIQYQTFVPYSNAAGVFRELLTYSNRTGIPSYLGVLKRHKPDNFLFSHAVDGVSLAMDIKVPANKCRLAKLRKMTNRMNQIVLEGGGRFYFAKDSTLTSDVVQSYLGEDAINQFKKLKQKCDPDYILQTDLYRRCFGDL
jgi:decaprenylphospho-beta-D-ribofuranose 2-oxidase